ncbi:MAG: cytochrome c oxidase assembly protein [Rhodobacteraceae bacterium]|nr:MAG: cytochrome c oxidase assembly protein [Paracoccaceae bacterium]
MKTSSNKRVVVSLVAIVTFMGAMGFAAVPFYNWFCAVTGYGGTTAVATSGETAEILDQTMIIRFDASKERDMPWTFKPVQRQMKIRIGEVGLAFYEAHNPTDRVIAGTASYNVAPFTIGEFFTKIDCFCFTEQILQPGQTVQMPVTFYVDPEIVNDRDGKLVNSITLSYTFYETDLPSDQAMLDQPVDDATTSAVN